jgi:hypothetical protein
MPARLRFTVGPAYAAALVPAAMVVGAWLLLWLVGGALAENPWPTQRAAANASGAVLLGAIAVLIALPRVLRLPLAGIALGASTGLSLVDLVTLRHYHDVLSVGDWGVFANLPLVGPSVAAHVVPSDLVVLAPLVLAALGLR